MSRFKSWCWVVPIMMVVAGRVGAGSSPMATTQTVSGAVTLLKGGAAKAAALAAHTALYARDVVTTGADGKATLLFTDGSQVRLNANARVEITPPSKVGKKGTSLFKATAGEVWSRLRPGKVAQARGAIAAVRGTEFVLAVADDGTTTLTVLAGKVDFSNEHGAVAVGESQQSVARPGAAPTAPVTIQNTVLMIEWTLELDRALIPREKFYVSPDRSAISAEVESRSERAQAQPNEAAAHRDLADALFDAARQEDALKQYTEADRLAPNQAATSTRQGDALLELGRLDEAAEKYRAALTVNPQHAPALVGLAWLALARDRASEAQAVAEQAVVADARSAEARVALGLALMRQPGKLTEAQASLERALTGDPEAVRYQARAWLALVHSARDDQESALKEGKAAVQASPQSALAYGNLSLVRFFRNEPAEAARAARRAVRLNPDSVAARCGLGQALLAQGDVGAAARTAAQAVALDPALPQARYLLGLADAQHRDLRHAARELQECLRLAPDFLAAASALARVYTSMGRKKEAIALLTDLLPRHRQADGVRAALGQVYYQQGAYQDAVRQYREALQQKPNSPLYHAELARALLDANRLNEALHEGQQAVRLAPAVGQYHAILGLTYDFARLSAQAEREYREALALDPRNALAHLVLGLRAAELDPKEGRLIPKKTGQSLTDLLREGLQTMGSTSAVGSLTQAFLYDPAISKQVLRGGIDGEIASRVGDETPLSVALTHRFAGAQGAFHSLGTVGREEDDGFRPNDDVRASTLSGNLTLVSDPRTSLFARVSYQRNEQGFAGPASTPDHDDRSIGHDSLYQLAARRRIGARNYLWLGLSRPSQQFDLLDPDLDSRFDYIHDAAGNRIGYNTSRQAVASRALVPELRFEIGLSHNPMQPAILTLGATRASLAPSLTADDFIAVGPPPVILQTFERLDADYLQAYAQWTQTLNDRVSFTAQVRKQQLDSTTTSSLLGGGTASTTEASSRWLPSLVANYRANDQTLFRVLYNCQAQGQELVSTALTPLETLRVTEPLVMPKGSPDRTQTLEFDAERYLGPDELLKVFFFSTTARGVKLADLPDMAEVQRSGVGLRYERQVGRNLYGQVGCLFNRTTNETPYAPFDGGIAPYQPMRLAGLGLNYVDPAGTKVGLQLNHTGRFFQDTGALSAVTRPRFPARTYVDLTLAKEPNLQNEFFVKVTNLFNADMIQFNDYPTGERRVQVGWTRRW